jgi:hypothetical protein
MNEYSHISSNHPLVELKNQHKTSTPDVPTNQKGNVPITYDDDPSRHRSPYKLTYYVAGKPKRKFFPSEKEAEKFWINHKRLEKKLGGLAGSADASDIIVIDRLKRKLPEGSVLDDVMDFYLTHRPQNPTPTLGVAVDTLINLKRNGLKRSAAHSKDLEVRLTVFRRAFGDDKSLLFFNRNNVLDWLLSLKVAERTKKNYRNALSNLFSYWHARKCLPVNPMKEIAVTDLPKVKGKRKVILSPIQAKAVMAYVLSESPEYAEFFALQLFVGMRDSQAERVEREFIHIDQKRIIIPADICKTEDDWILQDLAPAVWEWLKINKDTPGPIAVQSKRQWGSMRVALSKLRPEDGQITRWPWNALRRSFCTYDITQNESADKTAIKLQHRNAQRLYASYLSALRTKPEAKDYFSTTPKSVRGLWPKLLANAEHKTP